jgi:hypothetical protein
MPDYKMNTPIRAGQETLWYRTLRAIYKADKPLSKKEWLTLANVSYSDFPPQIEKDVLGIHSRWSYRHWRGLYPAMFKHFQYLKLVSYNCKTKKWSMNKPDYKIFCLSLNIEP